MSKVSLFDPTPQSEVKQRQGPGGRMLDYIDARFVMDRLDAAVGPENWQDRFEDLPNGSVRCGIGITFDAGKTWNWKWDVGDQSDIEATKGAHSDAFKRAGVKWGIGRDLYGDHAAPTSKPATAPRTAAAPRQHVMPRNDEDSAMLARMEEREPYPWDGMGTLPEQAAEIFDGMVETGKCPDHDKPWKNGAKGYFCPTPVEKSGDRVTKWCQQKPSRAWVASQELVPA